MARLTDSELIDQIARYDRSLAEITARKLRDRDAHIAGLVDDVRRVMPRIGMRNATPDVVAALDRLRAAVRDS